MESVQRPPDAPHSLTFLSKTLLQRLSQYKERREEMSETPTCPFNAPTSRFSGVASDAKGTTERPNPEDAAAAVHDSCQTVE